MFALRLATAPIVIRFGPKMYPLKFLQPQISRNPSWLCDSTSDENETWGETNWELGSIAKLSSRLPRKQSTIRIHLSVSHDPNCALGLVYTLSWYSWYQLFVHGGSYLLACLIPKSSIDKSHDQFTFSGQRSSRAHQMEKVHFKARELDRVVSVDEVTRRRRIW
jgi:hypothetical protein